MSHAQLPVALTSFRDRRFGRRFQVTQLDVLIEVNRPTFRTLSRDDERAASYVSGTHPRGAMDSPQEERSVCIRSADTRASAASRALAGVSLLGVFAVGCGGIVGQASADSGTSSPVADAGTPMNGCGGGLQSGSPWPMYGACPSLRGRSMAKGPSTPSAKWFYATEAPVTGQPSIAADGTVYFSDHNGKLYAVGSDGSLRWSFSGAGERFVGTPAIAADGTIIVQGSKLYAVSPNGTLAWTFTVPTYATGDMMSPSIGTDGTIYVTNGNQLFAVRSSGAEAWSMSANTRMPVIGSNGTVYAMGSGGTLQALGPGGQVKWTFGSSGSQMSVADNGSVLFTMPTPGASNADSLTAVRPDGTPSWSLDLGYAWAFEPATAADGTIYVDTGSGLAAVNPDGTKRWVAQLTGASGGWAPVVGADGTVYVGTNASAVSSGPGPDIIGAGLQAISADGERAWIFQPQATFTSPSMGADGTLYAGVSWSQPGLIMPKAPAGASNGVYAIGP
jgi:hypothetical protein